jgi:uncharacterized membrane protein YdfJ with MMPL/SSD domain
MSKDYNDLVKGSAPIVFAFVLTLAFLLLMVTFRSIVVPIKAIVLNLLFVGASYGALTLIFQHGWLHKQLGFDHEGSVDRPQPKSSPELGRGAIPEPAGA